MTSTRATLVVRSLLVPWLVGTFVVSAAGAAALALTAARAPTVVTLLAAALVFVVLAVRAGRMGIHGDPDGFVARGVGATRRYRWSEIEAFGTREHILISARLTDGREVDLLHYRGLGDRSTDDAARRIDRWAREHGTSDERPTVPGPASRRLPQPVALALGGTLVAAAAVYTVWTGHWAGVAAGVATLLMARHLGPRAGDGRQFHPVPPPGDPGDRSTGRGPA